jgi:hypothetical protein
MSGHKRGMNERQCSEAQKEELGIDGGPEAESIETWAVNIAEKISDGNI